MYREWAAARDASGPLARSFAKIAAFLRAVASGLRGDGFTDAALVMERIASGKVGGRGPEGCRPGRFPLSPPSVPREPSMRRARRRRRSTENVWSMLQPA